MKQRGMRPHPHRLRDGFLWLGVDQGEDRHGLAGARVIGQDGAIAEDLDFAAAWGGDGFQRAFHEIVVGSHFTKLNMT